MPRISNPIVVAFKVELTEYERGWGQKHWILGTLITSQKLAKQPLIITLNTTT